MVTIYTDGSNRGIEEFSSAIVVLNGPKTSIVHAECKSYINAYVEYRNISGEVFGALMALKYALDHNETSLHIVYDYLGVEMWTKTWRTNNDLTKMYKKLMNSSPIEITFEKVKGHSHVQCNEIADYLAKRALGIKKKDSKIDASIIDFTKVDEDIFEG